MAANLTEDLLRSVLQLPARPYSDVFPYDGAPFQDLTVREPVRILLASGTSSGAAYNFRLGIDFQLTAGTIDWTLPGARKPDYATAYTIDYTCSRLGSAAASSAMWVAGLVVPPDLGSKFPYGTVSPQGIAYDDLATYGQLLYAVREATHSLATSDIDTADKYRRGTVLVDDTKKWEDWLSMSKEYDAKYRKFLVVARGAITRFSVASADLSALVLDSDFTSIRRHGTGGDSYTSNDFGGMF